MEVSWIMLTMSALYLLRFSATLFRYQDLLITHLFLINNSFPNRYLGGGELESSANVDLHKRVLDQFDSDRKVDSYSVTVNESGWARRGEWSNALAHVLEQWYQDLPIRKGTGGHCRTKVKIVQRRL